VHPQAKLQEPNNQSNILMHGISTIYMQNLMRVTEPYFH